MAEKKNSSSKNRCWPGYEPVPGKKANQQGSCRPKAKSKLGKSEEKFRNQRRHQLDKWQAEHPRTRPAAAHHRGSPPQGQKE